MFCFGPFLIGLVGPFRHKIKFNLLFSYKITLLFIGVNKGLKIFSKKLSPYYQHIVNNRQACGKLVYLI